MVPPIGLQLWSVIKAIACCNQSEEFYPFHAQNRKNKKQALQKFKQEIINFR